LYGCVRSGDSPRGASRLGEARRNWVAIRQVAQWL